MVQQNMVLWRSDGSYGQNTVKLQNFWTPEKFAVIYKKFKQRGQNLGYFIKKMEME